jgi:hypothetical protein
MPHPTAAPAALAAPAAPAAGTAAEVAARAAAAEQDYYAALATAVGSEAVDRRRTGVIEAAAAARRLAHRAVASRRRADRAAAALSAAAPEAVAAALAEPTPPTELTEDGVAKVVNPRTGRLVIRDGDAGKRVYAAYAQALASYNNARLAAPAPQAEEIPGDSARLPPLNYQSDGTGKITLPNGARVPINGRAHKSFLSAYSKEQIAREKLARSGRDIVPRPYELVETTVSGNYTNFTYEIDWAGADEDDLRVFVKTAFTAAERAGPAYEQTVVTFVDESETARAYEYRSIHGLDSAGKLSFSVLLAELANIEVGKVKSGSDRLRESYTLDTSRFDIGTFNQPPPPAGGAVRKFTGISTWAGSENPFFVLKNFTDTKLEETNDCLFDVLRAVRKAEHKDSLRQRAVTIRRNLELGAGPIPADSAVIDKIARLFDLRVEIITGMVVVPDSEREYDDDQASARLKNKCLSAPVHKNVIASGGDLSAPLCEVFLADGHYEYIVQHKPVDQCPYTGDILFAGLKYNPTTSSSQELLAAGAHCEFLHIAARVESQGRTWFAYDDSPREKKEYEERVIVYDYETVYTASGKLTPYALGYIEFNPDEVTFDFNNMESSVTVCLDSTKKYGVTTSLLDKLRRAPLNIRYRLISFNGARFDHFLLADAANRAAMLSDAFMTDGQLRSISIGRHTTLDLAKLIPATSLKSACDSFATKPKKQEGFSHTIPQQAYEQQRLPDWMRENSTALFLYLTKDVLSTASLLILLRNALRTVSGIDILHEKNISTIGGIAWKMMSARCPLPTCVSSEALDRHIRSAITGGRVQVYQKSGSKQPIVISNEQLRMVDFASLYPTAMAAVTKAQELFDPAFGWGRYPVKGASEPHEVDGFVEGAVGVYTATIHAQPWPNVLPRRVEDEPLDWNYRGEFTTTCTHLDLALIARNGGSFTVHSGYVWDSCELGIFAPFIQDLADAKDSEDQKKKVGDLSYNPALREVFKLLMNSASGKCCQANYDDMTVIARGANRQAEALRNMCPKRPRTWWNIGNDTCIITGKKANSAYTKNAKPSILAVLIYSYSRALVWQTLCQHNILYSDTDSGLFFDSDYQRIRERFPDLDPTGRNKRLGDLEEELGAHHTASAYLMAPKDYAIFTRDAAGNILGKSKIRAKGINQRSDRLIKDEFVAEIAKLSITQMTAEYNGESTERTQPLSDLAVMEQFYRKRALGTAAHVLTSQIMRSWKDQAQPFTLTQRFLVKKLNPVAPDEEPAQLEEDDSEDN